MRRTALRTEDTHDRYVSEQKGSDFFRDAPSVMDFNYWRVIDNEYPYDAITKKHQLLAPRRKIASFEELDLLEISELSYIVNERLGYVDSVMLNLPKQQSVPDWLHFHLLTYIEIDGN